MPKGFDKKMPFIMRKTRGKNCYTVRKRDPKASGRRVFAKCTTRKNAEKQLRLLRAVTYNKTFKLQRRS